MLFKINLNKQIQRNFYSKTFVMYTYSFNFASVTNQQSVVKGYKNGCHGINRDFVRAKIVPTANIVTSILIS